MNVWLTKQKRMLHAAEVAGPDVVVVVTFTL